MVTCFIPLESRVLCRGAARSVVNSAGNLARIRCATICVEVREFAGLKKRCHLRGRCGPTRERRVLRTCGHTLRSTGGTTIIYEKACRTSVGQSSTSVDIQKHRFHLPNHMQYTLETETMPCSLSGWCSSLPTQKN